MSSKAIKEKSTQKKDRGWEYDAAPSDVQADEPAVARWMGLFGLTFFTVGLVAIGLNKLELWPSRISTGWAIMLTVFGLGCLLYHAAQDVEIQVRRAYGVFALVWLALAVITSLLPSDAGMGALFLPLGWPAFCIAFLFFLPFIRNETNLFLRERAIYLLGLAGAVLAVVGMGSGLLDHEFLLPQGLIISLLGLAYLWSFIVTLGTSHSLAYRAGVAMGVAGFLLGVITWFMWGWPWSPDGEYFVKAGFFNFLVGGLYLSVSLGLTSNHQVVVLTRRELAGFFFSPIAYIVLFVFFAIATLQYYVFTDVLSDFAGANQALPEPVVHRFIFQLLVIPVIAQIIVVPLLTMRVFSEERRSGTYEVLLTAPVSEGSIVLSKFIAVLFTYILTWLPYGMYLVALRIVGDEPFDYRPAISFFFGLVCSGAGFLAMGVFFSSLTRNQIVAAVLSILGMVFLLVLYIIQSGLAPENPLIPVIQHTSFIDLWATTLVGRLPIPDLMLHMSIAALWLFLTVKVLEARKWS